MDVIFKHNEWIAVEKPPLTLSVPDRGGTDRPVLGRELEAHLGIRVYPVHRLDFGVGGVILYALTPEAQKLISAEFEAGRVKKTYQAITTSSADGSPPPEGQVHWEDYLVRGKKRSFVAPHGKRALTDARVTGVLEAGPGRALLQWELYPLTGRPHQLRVQLALRGFAILGDTLYGGISRSPYESGVIALRAVRIEFTFRGEKHALETPGLTV